MKRKFLTRLGYGVGDFGSQFAFFIVNTYFMFFMTNIMGISASTAGVIYLVVMVFDAINDPIIGNMADRTKKTKLGKYRKWTIWASIPYAASMWLSFWNPGWSADGQVAWAILIHLIYSVCATAWQVPYGTLPNRMTTDANERMVLGTFRDWFANLAKFLIGFVVIKLISVFSVTPEVQDSIGYFGMAGVCALICTVFALIAGLSSREVVDTGEDSKQTVAILDGLKSVFTNKPALLVMFVAFLATISLNFKAAITPYYAQYYLGNPAMAATILPVIFTLPLFFGVFVPALTKRIGVKAMFIISMSCAGLSGAISLVSSSFLAIIAASLLMSIMAAFLPPTLWGLLPQLADYGEYRTSIVSPGSYYSLNAFFIKCSTGLSGLLISWSLALGNFDAGLSSQAPETVSSIFIWHGLVPIVCAAISIICMVFYKLSQEILDNVQKELTVLRSKNQQ